jgi:heme o synthase
MRPSGFETTSTAWDRTPSSLVIDTVALTKPRITALVVTTTAGGIWLAPGALGRATAAMAIAGVALVVAGANTLNMYIERDIDGRMHRTRDRPLPAGRIRPAFALWFGVGISAASIPLLAVFVNLTTALLALLAHLSYVLAYTPLKQKSHAAVFVGAIAGAMPPLLGWTAVTGAVQLGGLLLFLVLYFWQIPHFLAISIFRRSEYARGGLKVMPNVAGMTATKHSIVRHTMALVIVSLMLVPLGVVRPAYGLPALMLGAVFLGWALWGLRSSSDATWARSLFFVSLAYLTLLFLVILGQAGAPLAVLP